MIKKNHKDYGATPKNFLIEQSIGEWLVFTDDDDILYDNYTGNSDFWSYEECKEWINTNFGSLTQRYFFKLHRDDKIHKKIPKAPYKVFKNFKYSDFLNGKRTIPKEEYYDYETALNMVHELNISSNKEWRKYCKSGEKDVKIPNNPEIIYSESWVDWYEWLGKVRKGFHRKKIN